MNHFLSLILLGFLFLTINGLPMKMLSLIPQSTTETPSPASTSSGTTSQWTAISYLNAAPEQRRGHSSIAMGNQLWIFGGCYLDQKCFNDFHSFDTEFISFYIGF